MCPGFESLRCYFFPPILPAPDMSSIDLIESVYAFSRHLLPPGTRLVIAVSGGSDSTALFHLMLALRKRLSVGACAVAHVNYGLRGRESDEDERFVRRMAEDAGVPCYLKTVSGKSLHDPGMEEWARRIRYEFFLSVKIEHGYTAIATGHTADDQAETVLLRLMRGTGLKGLVGIRARREDGVVRPLLSVRRSELQNWLAEKSISFRNDSSNADVHFSRNAVRQSILPAMTKDYPGIVRELIECSHRAEGAWSLLQPRIDEWICRTVSRTGPDSLEIDKNGFSDQPFAEEALAELFRREGIMFDQQHLEEFQNFALRTSGEFKFPGGWSCFPSRRSVVLTRATVRSDVSVPLSVPGISRLHGSLQELIITLLKPEQIGPFDPENRTVFLDAGQTGSELVYRTWTPEDKFWPLGAKGPTNLLLFLKKQHLNVHQRDGLGVVATPRGQVVWIPGVQIAHPFRVQPGTTAILSIGIHKSTTV